MSKLLVIRLHDTCTRKIITGSFTGTSHSTIADPRRFKEGDMILSWFLGSITFAIYCTKTMASGPITSWEIDGETVETVADFIFGGSRITADGDCSHEIKRCLLLGRKVMTNLDSILKSRDITLPTKVRLVKAMVFPVVMYGCESWTMKKAECQRIYAFEL